MVLVSMSNSSTNIHEVTPDDPSFLFHYGYLAVVVASLIGARRNKQ